MKAVVGDRIVIASNKLDTPVRDGKIVEVRHGDGTPPYLVEWSDTGQTGLVFPGPDAHVEHFPAQGDEATGTGAARHLKRWRIDVDVFEEGDDTSAHATLVAGSAQHLDARGHAHRRQGDVAVPEIGDEVAVARALRRLSDQLLSAASEDIAHVEGHPVRLQH